MKTSLNANILAVLGVLGWIILSISLEWYTLTILIAIFGIPATAYNLMYLKAEYRIAKLIPKLVDLKNKLIELNKIEEPIHQLVKLFNLISPWHDNIEPLIAKINKLKIPNKMRNEFIKIMNELQMHFVNAGRQRYGWNRTRPGEGVTLDDVYLGNINGLWTKTARFWLDRKDDKKGGLGFSGMENLNAYDVVSDQASSFIKSHKGRMVELINQLELAMQ